MSKDLLPSSTTKHLTVRRIIERMQSRKPAIQSNTHKNLTHEKICVAAGRPPAGDHILGGNDIFPQKPLTSAAVLIALVERSTGIHIILTRRQEHLRDHSGQISFPGGRVEATDSSTQIAALREASEEIGLDPKLPQLLGELDLYVTRTGFIITPVVALLAPPFSLRAAPAEVAEIFEIPLSFILDSKNHHIESHFYQGQERRFFVLPFEDRHIWGATAGMLVMLSAVLRDP